MLSQADAVLSGEELDLLSLHDDAMNAGADDDSDGDYGAAKTPRGKRAAKRASSAPNRRKSAVTTAKSNVATVSETATEPADTITTTTTTKPGRGRGRRRTTPEPESAPSDPAATNGRDTAAKPRKRTTTATPKVTKGKGKAKARQFDSDYISELALSYPDQYWNDIHDHKSARIRDIDAEHPLTLVSNVDIRDQGAITGMALSPDGTLLATCCNLGSVKLWDLASFTMVQKLRDATEPNIDEFYVCKFTPDHSHLIVGGKLKDRMRWSEADDDNHILPCPIKIFNVTSSKVVARLDGHSEEILCIKRLQFKGDNYLISTSQDGYVIRWKLDDDWCTLLEKKAMEDGVTCMAFTVSFVPNTGNKYFLGACDDNIKLYDFENASLLKTFENIYSSYCDCGKFIECLEVPIPGQSEATVADASAMLASQADNGANSKTNGKSKANATAVVKPLELPTRPFAYFVTRGVELLDAENNTIASRPNTCTLHRLLYPNSEYDSFDLEEIRRYHHAEYVSNSWLIKVASNGRYLCAPTLTGQTFVFHLPTGKVTAVLKGHEEIEVRDVLFHPSRNLLFTSADDGCVKVYTQTPDAIEREIEACLNGGAYATKSAGGLNTSAPCEDDAPVDID